MSNIDKLTIELQKEKMSAYLNQFEKYVFISCFEQGIFSKKISVGVKESKLAPTEFGNFIGRTFEYDQFLVLNYYGLNKFSTGLLDQIKSLKEHGFNVKLIDVVVIHFASIKLKDITTFAPDLVNQFADFKNFLVKIRGFPSNKSIKTDA